MDNDHISIWKLAPAVFKRTLRTYPIDILPQEEIQPLSTLLVQTKVPANLIRFPVVQVGTNNDGGQRSNEETKRPLIRDFHSTPFARPGRCRDAPRSRQRSMPVADKLRIG